MNDKKKYLWIYGAMAVIAIGGLIFFFVQNKNKSETPPLNKGTQIPLPNEVNPETGYGKRLASFLNDRARKQRIVDKLLHAMKGVGTDFTAIKEALKEIEDENYMKELIRFFHYKKYRNPFNRDENLNLIGWFKEELRDGQYQELKDMYPNLL